MKALKSGCGSERGQEGRSEKAALKKGPFRIFLGFYFHFLIQWYNSIDRFTMFISNVGRQERRKESMCFYKTGTLEIA